MKSSVENQGLAVNHVKLTELLSQALSAIDSIKGKEVMLVIGNTGAGKSTIINSLLSVPMETYGRGMRKKIRINEALSQLHNQSGPAIGKSNIRSATLFPSAYKASNEEYYYCDFPGFFDTRGIEEQIVAAIATKLAINYASKIKGIMVVLESPLDRMRSHGIRTTLEILQQLFNQEGNSAKSAITPVELSKSLMFAINKSDLMGESVEILEEIRQDARAQSREENADSDQEYKDVLTMIELMLSDKKRIFEVNPLDQEATQHQVKKQLKKCKSVSATEFGFPGDVDLKFKLIDYLDQVALDAKHLVENMMDIPVEISKKKQQLVRERKHLQELSEQLISLNDSNAEDSLDTDTSALDKLIAETKERIKQKQSEKKQLSSKLSGKIKEEADLNKPDISPHWTDTFDEKKVFGNVERGKVNTKKFKYNAEKYTHANYVIGSDGNEIFTCSDNPQTGNYEASFVTSPYVYGTCAVTISMPKNLIPTNARKIQQLVADIKELKQSINGVNADVKDDDEHIKQLELKIVELTFLQQQDARKCKELMIETLSKDKDSVFKRITTLESRLVELEMTLSESKIAYTNQSEAIQSLKSITRVLPGLCTENVNAFLRLSRQFSFTANPNGGCRSAFHQPPKAQATRSNPQQQQASAPILK